MECAVDMKNDEDITTANFYVLLNCILSELHFDFADFINFCTCLQQRNP